ncbi:LPXTG cell wall anchor domain-containing protein [Isoptericola sp. BMS4]|uniref:LPXTG cell wall anchor domain-containing protein n=1 Tax=Isoptericola sp. BMS4 TaxID=2527875 RepID=UPI001420EF8E|nr:LPXTG cell wall anchor domain-containing protein [Isoptericola sp. BMS4]
MGIAGRRLVAPVIGTVTGTLLALGAVGATSAGAATTPSPGADGYEPPEEPTLTAEIFEPVCDGDVPYLRYAVKATGTENDTVTITWIHPSGADVVQAGLPLSGRVLWPGAEVADDGTPLDWPGWRLEDGTWVVGDEYDWVRPSVDVLFEVNPELTLTADYPPSSPDCATNPPGQPPSTPPEPGDDTTPASQSTVPAAVPPGSATPQGPVALPRTGAQVAGLAALAALLVGAGALAVGTVRRRRAQR